MTVDQIKTNFPNESLDVELLARKAREILTNPEKVYDLAGRRLAFRCFELQQHFLKPENTFRFAVIGNPNLGKTTYSYTVAHLLELYFSAPLCHYVDLDLYSQAGDAISGKVDWTNRQKRTFEEVPQEETLASIQNFAQAGPGIVLGDFPGRLDNIHQTQRLGAANLGLILATNIDEKDEWVELCGKAGIGHRWVISHREKPNLEGPIYPQIAGLSRKVIFSTPMLVSATSVLEEAAFMTNAPQSNYENIFTQPELVVLQEYLDFLFSIQNV